MNLKVVRKEFTSTSTIGEMFTNGEFECFTLEDTVREVGVKVDGKTAIPKGTYEVTITFSERFKRPLPLLMHVPMFVGIRIHPLNTAAETEVCIGVGQTKAKDFIGKSVAAFDILFGKIEAALKTEKVFVEVTSA